MSHHNTTSRARRRPVVVTAVRDSRVFLAISSDDTTDADTTDADDDAAADRLPDYNASMEDFAFGAVARAYGDSGLEALRTARVAVVGLGGVGSYCVEALARSGVGYLTLIDLDEVCISNLSRQVEATRDNAAKGTLKVDALAERVLAVNPFCRVSREASFLDASNCAELLSPDARTSAPPFDCVIDCLDDFAHKAEVIAHCVRGGIPVVTTGVAAGFDNAAAVSVADLASISTAAADGVLRKTRNRLRRDHGFTTGTEAAGWGVPCVYVPVGSNALERSAEAEAVPEEVPEEETEGEGDAWGSMSLDDLRGGALCFVTGAQGFCAAGEAVNGIVRRARARGGA